MTAAASGAQILTLTGLRFDASLGVLDHEKTAPQPIQVDAELSLGRQPLAPRDDDLAHVLDYRRVRQIIIDECTAGEPDWQTRPAADAAARRARGSGEDRQTGNIRRLRSRHSR